MKNQRNKALLSLVLSMSIFGTIGIVRKYIDLPSSVIALGRAFIGTLFLALLLFIRRQPFSVSAVRKQALSLLLSGCFLGFNWILLFEAYCYTTVATATLCYYMAPVIVILAAPLLFRETLTVKKGLCALAAVVGAVLVSGILTGGSGSSDGKGVLLGLGAAVLYASVVLLNKGIRDVPAMDRTLVQLAVSAIVLIPYVLLTEDMPQLSPGAVELGLLLLAGILHTGIAYALYFDSIHALSAQTAALFSYIDPVLAILLSALLLQEPMGISGIFGAVLILGAAFLSEYEPKKA